VQVQFIKGGDTGAALNRVILLQLKGTPPADVFYGIDNTFLSRALENDIFEPYASPLLDQVPIVFRLDPENRALPIDYGDVCINYDKAWFSERKLDVPASFEDLLKPEYKGLLVVENPATSSPGLAFLLATIAHFGEDGWQAYWQALVENEIVVTSDWESAYYTQFSGSSGRGPQPMVVSYASSPAAELIFAETDIEESPTASIISAGTCFRQIEFAGILKGTENRLLAEKFIDFMLSKDFQADVPLQMFVFPVVKDVALPEAFQQAVEIPAAPAILDPALIAANRETWIKTWTEIVLQ
jgi:thiamine transport system substrate-binding protein